MKMSNKVYLLMCATGSWDDYMNTPVDAFTSKELAEKAANGFSDIIDILSASVEAKINEANLKEDEFYSQERPEEEYYTFWEQHNKEYGMYYTINDYNPSYSVQEIDLIN